MKGICNLGKSQFDDIILLKSFLENQRKCDPPAQKSKFQLAFRYSPSVIGCKNSLDKIRVVCDNLRSCVLKKQKYFLWRDVFAESRAENDF